MKNSRENGGIDILRQLENGKKLDKIALFVKININTKTEKTEEKN